MYSIETLDIMDDSKEPVPNTFFRQESETRHLAILLPGFGYTSHMPVMYYPCLALLSRGADVLRTEFNYVKNTDFLALTKDERRRRAADDASAVYTRAIRQRKYDMLTLVGKSIGTYAMGHVITSIPDMPKFQCLWLTPILKSGQLLSQIKQVRHKALFVIGTADPYYDESKLDDLLKTTHGKSIVIEGANHSLEIEGDAIRSLQALQRMMNGIEEFLG
ncbi:MAG: hypothetical protein HQL09_08170 [Nitrospirae bacterium]|nr:hypothetical protein [Nitrospirota bacterium]